MEKMAKKHVDSPSVFGIPLRIVIPSFLCALSQPPDVCSSLYHAAHYCIVVLRASFVPLGTWLVAK